MIAALALLALAQPSFEPIQDRIPKKGDEVAVLETAKGKIVIMFYPDKAPNHVTNFKDLVKSGFYNGTRFHRNIPGFMIQGGDPNSKDLSKFSMWGTGGHVVDGVEKTIKAEFNDIKHVRGVVSMARSMDPDSASSQFFIMHADAPHLDGQYSAFGYVVSGMSAVDEIVKTGDPRKNGETPADKAVVITKASLAKWPIKSTDK